MSYVHYDSSGTFHPSVHNYYNDSTNSQQFGQVYYYENSFDYEREWKQHPWNIREEEDQQSMHQTVPTVVKQRARFPNLNQQDMPRFPTINQNQPQQHPNFDQNRARQYTHATTT